MLITTKGIRISDACNDVISVQLPDILEEVRDGALFHWSILFLDAMGDLGRSVPVFEKQILDAERGFFISWEELNILSKKFYQIIDITLLGCKDEKLLRRYDSDQEMYEACDISIQMIDSGWWEVFSKDESFIDRLAAKFKEIEFLQSDYNQ